MLSFASIIFFRPESLTLTFNTPDLESRKHAFRFVLPNPTTMRIPPPSRKYRSF